MQEHVKRAHAAWLAADELVKTETQRAFVAACGLPPRQSRANVIAVVEGVGREISADVSAAEEE